MPWAVFAIQRFPIGGTSALELSRASLGIRSVTSTYSSRALARLREHREAIGNVLARYGASNPSNTPSRVGLQPGHRVVSRSARERLTDIQTSIAKVYIYRSSLRGEHSDMAISAILREIGIIGEAVNALPDDKLAIVYCGAAVLSAITIWLRRLGDTP